MELTYEHWSQVPRTGAAWPWKYFVPEEVACQGTGKLLVNREFLNNLDNLRGILAHPVRVLSAYRSAYHNARVGGAVFSRHLKADAADISIVGQDKIKIRDTAREAGFTGFGYYQTFLHVDLGRPRDWGKEKWND
tara:strand:- start:252 stop:656 length:405 start_codon:yes stop_codon:yes gene_type:complete